jgi:hypothetical protein
MCLRKERRSYWAQLRYKAEGCGDTLFRLLANTKSPTDPAMQAKRLRSTPCGCPAERVTPFWELRPRALSPLSPFWSCISSALSHTQRCPSSCRLKFTSLTISPFVSTHRSLPLPRNANAWLQPCNMSPQAEACCECPPLQVYTPPLQNKSGTQCHQHHLLEGHSS